MSFNSYYYCNVGLLKMIHINMFLTWISDCRRFSVRNCVSHRRISFRSSSYEMCFSAPPSRIERFCAAWNWN